MRLSTLPALAILAACCGSALAELPGAPGGAAPPPRDAMLNGPGGPGPGSGPRFGPGPGAGPAREGRGPGSPLLHGVQLDEAQDDKVFAILHALEPQRREQARILRQSSDALRTLGGSGQYDESKASALAKAAGAAMAALALMDARADARILAVMRPEQRREADGARQRHRPRFEQ